MAAQKPRKKVVIDTEDIVEKYLARHRVEESVQVTRCGRCRHWQYSHSIGDGLAVYGVCKHEGLRGMWCPKMPTNATFFCAHGDPKIK